MFRNDICVDLVCTIIGNLTTTSEDHPVVQSGMTGCVMLCNVAIKPVSSVVIMIGDYLNSRLCCNYLILGKYSTYITDVGTINGLVQGGIKYDLQKVFVLYYWTNTR